MNTQTDKTKTRDPLVMGLLVLVGLSLLAAAYFLAQGFPTNTPTESITIPIAPQPGLPETNTGEDGWTITIPTTVTPDDLRELATALAAVLTALTGLFGIVFTQIWRRREEDRTDKTHALALERERLELERERMQLEKDRLDLEKQRKALTGEA